MFRHFRARAAARLRARAAHLARAHEPFTSRFETRAPGLWVHQRCHLCPATRVVRNGRRARGGWEIR